MKSASPELVALLATRQFVSADLFHFALTGGGELRYCSGDKDITWNSATWQAGEPLLVRKGKHARCRWSIGLEVDSLQFDVMPGAALVQGVAFLSAVRQGLFDGAEMTLYRAVMPTYGDTAAGAVTMFAGRVAEIEADRAEVRFTVHSHLELLNQKMPRNLYQSGCVNTLFDPACGLNRASLTVTGAASSGSLAHRVMATLAAASGYYDLGVLVFTDGANAGISRSIKSYSKGTPGVINLIAPFPNVPAAGDSFEVTPGCDKQQGTCQNTFANLANFRGFPYVPRNTTAV